MNKRLILAIKQHAASQQAILSELGKLKNGKTFCVDRERKKHNGQIELVNSGHEESDHATEFYCLECGGLIP